jgi:hypothetical protein
MRDIKEKMCSVAYDYKTALQKPDPLTEEGRSYELPDGQIIQVNHHVRYNATEILFNPNLRNLKCLSIPQLAVESIGKVNPDLKIVRLSLKAKNLGFI